MDVDKDFLKNKALNKLSLDCLRSVYETIYKDILRNSKNYLEFVKFRFSKNF